MSSFINWISIFVIFVIYINKSSTKVETTTPINFEQARAEIVANMKTQFNALQNVTSEFKAIFANESRSFEEIYKDMADKIGWYFREPTANETAELDRAMSKFYPFGGSANDYVDTKEKLEAFCNTRLNTLSDLKMWIRRKHHYNVIIQGPFNMIVDQIESQTEYYCNTTEHRLDYIKKINKVKAVNKDLVEAKEQLLDTAFFVHNSTFKVPKLGKICCSFWEYSKTLKKSIKDPETVAFVGSMTNNYFSIGTKYLCYFHPYDSPVCKEEAKEKTPKYPHTYNSILMEMVVLLSEIV